MLRAGGLLSKAQLGEERAATYSWEGAAIDMSIRVKKNYESTFVRQLTVRIKMYKSSL